LQAGSIATARRGLRAEGGARARKSAHRAACCCCVHLVPGTGRASEHCANWWGT
jgi:hypothetical protein